MTFFFFSRNYVSLSFLRLSLYTIFLVFSLVIFFLFKFVRFGCSDATMLCDAFDGFILSRLNFPVIGLLSRMTSPPFFRISSTSKEFTGKYYEPITEKNI